MFTRLRFANVAIREEKLRLMLWLWRALVSGETGNLSLSRKAESLKHIDVRCAKSMHAFAQMQRRCRKLVNDDFAAAATLRGKN